MTNKDQLENIKDLLKTQPFFFYDNKTINRGAMQLSAIVNLALESMQEKYDAKVEFVKPYEFNIIVTNNEKKGLEQSLKETFSNSFSSKYEGAFSDVKITDYSREENTHVAHVVIPEKYLR